jgi:hypothetical protein
VPPYVLKSFSEKVYGVCRLNPLNSYTLPSFANKVWRLLDSNTVTSVKSYTKNTSIYNDIRSSYYGGVTEVLIPFVSEGCSYDVNSLYPSIMGSIEMPLGEPILKDSKVLSEYYGFCYAKIKTNDQPKGLLPYRFFNSMITPNGSWEGWYYSEELKKAESLGYKIDVVLGYHYNRRGLIFKNFVNTFFKLKNNEDTAYRSIGKLILNSAYGYLGLNYSNMVSNIEFDITTQDNIEDPMDVHTNYRITNKVDLNVNQPYDRKTSVAIAAIIAAESRMKVLDARIHNRAAYTDTDSIILVGQEPLDFMEVDPVKLGSWKLEGEVIDGVFVGKKQYGFLRNGKEIVKTAGAPKNTFTWNEMYEVYKNNSEFTKIIKKLQLNNTDMSIKQVSMSVTLKNNNRGHIKIYGRGEKGRLLMGIIPLIINMEKLEDGTPKIKVFNPKTRLTIKNSSKDLHFTYEESVRYPTNIAGVVLPYDIKGDFIEGIIPKTVYSEDIGEEKTSTKDEKGDISPKDTIKPKSPMDIAYEEDFTEDFPEDTI